MLLDFLLFSLLFSHFIYTALIISCWRDNFRAKWIVTRLRLEEIFIWAPRRIKTQTKGFIHGLLSILTVFILTSGPSRLLSLLGGSELATFHQCFVIGKRDRCIVLHESWVTIFTDRIAEIRKPLIFFLHVFLQQSTGLPVLELWSFRANLWQYF